MTQVEMFESLKSLIEENFTNTKESIAKIRSDVHAIYEGLRTHRKYHGTRYVLINPDGELDGYFFNDHDYDSKLREFYTTADIKAGERLYMVNNYYEEKTFIVQYRIYSPGKNTMYLEVKAYDRDKSYADPDWCYTEEFEEYVRKLIDDENIREKARKVFDEYRADEDYEKYEDDYVAHEIAKQIDAEKRSYLDYQCLIYRVSAVVYKAHDKEFHKPARWEYDDM